MMIAKYINLKSICLVLTLVVLSATPLSVFAASSPWVQAEKAELRLVSESKTVGTETSLKLGLEFLLEPKWKIYWRSPGEAGLPPEPDFSGSNNLESAELRWPLPERFSALGIDTFGYHNQVLLPIDLKLQQPATDTNIKLKVDYLICEELCIPGSADLSLELKKGALQLDGEAELIAAAMDLVPTNKNDDLAIENFMLDMSSEQPTLVVSASSKVGFDAPDLLIEAPEGYYFLPPQLDMSSDGQLATFTTTAELLFEPDDIMNRESLRLTLVDQNTGVEVTAKDMGTTQTIPKIFVKQANQSPSFNKILSIVLLALIGGLILNLMPCVLPVLSIKLMSVIDKSGKSSRDIRAGFLATTAGIIVSFLVLALALIALKTAGASIGWGIQFQQPIFVLALLAIILLFAANMFGWFEIRLPSSLANLGGGAANKGLVSDFGTGAFATLLATPCSAPFLGTAVSFALVQNAGLILLIFAALGVGMALPYILVILFPKVVTYLPKPGVWMLKLRAVLGGLLVLTALWLLSILFTQLGAFAVYVAFGLSLLLVLVLWFTQKSAGQRLIAAVVSAALLIFLPIALKSEGPALSTELEAPWVAFDQAAIDQYIKEGKIVYVDVTADWCVTCKVNKAVVFASDEVVQAFESDTLVAMLADWTRPNDDINAYLQSFNRAGIPFNAIYSAKHPEGKALPEILTPGLVLEALESAR